jgi:hypothetical protein
MAVKNNSTLFRLSLMLRFSTFLTNHYQARIHFENTNVYANEVLECVYCAARSGAFNLTPFAFRLQRLTCEDHNIKKLFK